MVSKSIHACNEVYVVFCSENQASDSLESALAILAWGKPSVGSFKLNCYVAEHRNGIDAMAAVIATDHNAIAVDGGG